MTKYIVLVMALVGITMGLFTFDAFTDMVVWKDVALYGMGIIMACIAVFAYTNQQPAQPTKKYRNRY